MKINGTFLASAGFWITFNVTLWLLIKAVHDFEHVPLAFPAAAKNVKISTEDMVRNEDDVELSFKAYKRFLETLERIVKPPDDSRWFILEIINLNRHFDFFEGLERYFLSFFCSFPKNVHYRFWILGKLFAAIADGRDDFFKDTC